MTFAQRQTTLFSERIPFVKRRMTVITQYNGPFPT